MRNDLRDRLFWFAINVIRLTKKLPQGKEMDVIKYQLVKAATSSGANYEEAQAAYSRADFGLKIGISLKEIRETNYWLRILTELLKSNEEISDLCSESRELMLVLGSIASKTGKSKN